MIHETMYMNILTTQNNVRIKKNYTISPNLTQFLSSISLHPANLLVLQLGDKTNYNQSQYFPSPFTSDK